jgi:hypothetical protein
MAQKEINIIAQFSSEKAISAIKSFQRSLNDADIEIKKLKKDLQINKLLKNVKMSHQSPLSLLSKCKLLDIKLSCKNS